MDPNELLRKIDEYIRARKTGNCVDDWCHDLFCWIAKGGFEPDWSRYELGTSYYRCREVSEKKRKCTQPICQGKGIGTLTVQELPGGRKSLVCIDCGERYKME